MPDLSWPTILLIIELSLKAAMIAVVLLRKGRSPAVRLAWIVLIIALPFIGSLSYLLLGTTRLGRKRIRRHATIVAEIPASLEAHAPELEKIIGRVPKAYQSIANLAEAVGASMVVGGNHAELLSETEKLLETLVADIDAAEDHCHLLYYIVLDDQAGQAICGALQRAAGRGVTCRLLVDAVGSKAFLKSSLPGSLRGAGVEVVAALPVNIIRSAFARMDIRNHRQVAVIDGRIGYLGSQNIAEASFAPKPEFAPWVDASVRVEGPVVHDLQALFVQDWYMDTDASLAYMLGSPVCNADNTMPVQIMATGPNFDSLALRELLQTAVFAAREELVLTTPYFAPDEATEAAICIAALRGVQTHLVVPAQNDSKMVAAASRSRYQRLQAAGVNIHEFKGGLLHAKTITIDKATAMIGSANLDRRSLDLNFEVSMLVYDSDFASQLRFLQSSYMTKSTVLPSHAAADWPLHERLWNNAMGLISPLL